MFAKTYGSDQEQILVKIDRNDEGKPEVRFYTEPEGLGVCSLAVVFNDDESGWAKAQKTFDEMTQDKAFKMAQRIKDATGGMK